MSGMHLSAMSLFVICLLFFFTFSSSFAVKEYQDEVPGHEGQCKGKDQKFYKLGEVIKDEPCVRKICKGTAAPGSVYIEVERCAKVDKKAGCELKSGGKNYPDCCPRLDCKH